MDINEFFASIRFRSPIYFRTKKKPAPRKPIELEKTPRPVQPIQPEPTVNKNSQSFASLADEAEERYNLPGEDEVPSLIVPVPELSESDRNFKELAESLIKFRDQLLYFRDVMAESDIPQGVELVTTLYRETGRFMNANGGIEVLEGEGRFDPSKHMCAATKPAADAAQDGLIAETFKSGYVINGVEFRPPEVVIYKA